MSAPLSLMIFCGAIDVADRLRHLAALSSRPGIRGSRPRGTARGPRADATSSDAGTSRDAGRCPRGTCPPATSGRAHRQHRFVTRPGIEPDVEDVPLALEAASRRNRGKRGRPERTPDRPPVPRVGAVLFEHARGLFDERRRHERLAALRALDRRDRARPTRADATCTSRAGWRPCRPCGRAPTAESIHVVIARSAPRAA